MIFKMNLNDIKRRQMSPPAEDDGMFSQKYGQPDLEKLLDGVWLQSEKIRAE